MDPISQEARKAAAELRARSEELSEEVVARQYERQPGLWRPYGEEGRRTSVRDMGYHIGYLADSTLVREPALFVDYANWVKVLFHHLGLPPEGLGMTLQCTRDVVIEMLGAESSAQILPQIDAAIENLPLAPDTVGSFVDDSLPYADVAHKYLAALLGGSRAEASQLIEESVAGGASVADMYMRVFQPCQWEVGRLWQTRQISVADEHYCTAATQTIMSQLYPYVFGSQKSGLSMVSACVGDEMHEIGARMVADMFEMNGWDTTYLGANVPTVDIVGMVRKQRPQVLAISATLVSHLETVGQLIEATRNELAPVDVTILVGGYPFRVAPDLYRKVGADGTGLDAEDALETTRRIIDTG